jgi:protein-S-isoprenylcysteine O-methyltransferase Ste14
MSESMTRIKVALVWAGFAAFIGAIIFVSAGTWKLPMVWAVLTVLTVWSFLFAFTADSGLLRERFSPGPGNRDRSTQPLSGLALIAHFVLVGLDLGRFHWSLVPFGIQIAGLIGYAASLVFLLWSMRENPFYSSVVRVQSDRGHRAITTGPYRWVRHPGYFASLISSIAGGLAFGSWVAMLPVTIFVAVFIRRTVLEDRLLLAELEGYADYAQRVRYRLVPGLF